MEGKGKSCRGIGKDNGKSEEMDSEEEIGG